MVLGAAVGGLIAAAPFLTRRVIPAAKMLAKNPQWTGGMAMGLGYTTGAYLGYAGMNKWDPLGLRQQQGSKPYKRFPKATTYSRGTKFNPKRSFTGSGKMYLSDIPKATDRWI